MPMRRNSALIILAVIILFITFPFSCKEDPGKQERMAKAYCSACHLYPEPTLLDKKSWKLGVLPQMAMLMGISDSIDMFARIAPSEAMTVAAYLPTHPMLSQDDWTSLEQFFIQNAPDSLVLDQPVTMDSLAQFEPLTKQLTHPAYLTMLQQDESNNHFYMGNRLGYLFDVNRSLSIRNSIRLPSTPSHLKRVGDTLLLSLMGMMDPNDQPAGLLVRVNADLSHSELIVDSLKRPVYFEQADLDNDGVPEYVVCEFGNYGGALTVYQKQKDGKYFRHYLNRSPGARKVIIDDVNDDGRPDILAMMCQGDERILLYTNDGDLSFSSQILLRFPPVYGSNYFEIDDFNGDGFFDILTTNGDNGDYSNILKPYHAVRIFLNDGHNRFSETWSYPVPGASQAAAVDFDDDGDLDIAVISFFPDFVHYPERGFIYFENKGDMTFTPHTTPVAARGRWLVMETMDYDGDGDVDILLGATNFEGMGASMEIGALWEKEGVPFMVLKNRLH